MTRHDPKPLEDFSMWAMLQRGGQKANIPELKALVNRWVQMVTQKTAGQRGSKKEISWDEIERVKMGILCEAVALVLSGELDKMPTASNVLENKSIVNCRNCRWFIQNEDVEEDGWEGTCFFNNASVDTDDFCSHGLPKVKGGVEGCQK